MKLIRTLIDTKRSDGDVPLRPSELAEKPQSKIARPASKSVSHPVTRPSRALSEPPASEPVDPKLEEFKSDLADLTPRRTPVSTGPKRKKVWDLDAENLATLQEDVQTLPVSDPDTETAGRGEAPATTDTGTSTPDHMNMFEVPNPLAPRRNLSEARVRTRIKGYGANDAPTDVFDAVSDEAAGGLDFPVGWLVVTQGPGRGKSFTLQNVVSTIGRGLDQTITLNFGDDTISRSNHAAVAFDDQMNACFLGYGGKANLVRLNGRPVLTTEQLSDGDVIRIGETDLRYVAFCGPDFVWDDEAATNGPEAHG